MNNVVDNNIIILYLQARVCHFVDIYSINWIRNGLFMHAFSFTKALLQMLVINIAFEVEFQSMYNFS